MVDYKITQIRHLEIADFPKGQISETWLHIINNGIGEPVRIPILLARGTTPGPVVGFTAALHGNELNGIRVIQKLFQEIDVASLCGTVVGVLITNVPGTLLEQRKFNDGVDLNHIAPGKPHGTQSQLYMHRILDRIVLKFNYLVDLHTASFGRINSYYIRADMSNAKSARMARLQNPEIILDNPPTGTTMRGQAAKNGIASVTLELKDPHLFQYDVIEDSLLGAKNLLYDLNMQKGTILCPIKNTILCKKSYWTYTDEGGILSVYPNLTQYVKKGEIIAEVKNIFGKVTKTYRCPEDGVIIGKSVNPINQSGSRIIHLGIGTKEIPCITDEEI